VKCPDPGVYRNVVSDEYHSWEAVSNSRLSLLKRSPLHYQHGFTAATAQMALGSLVHSGVLEPLSIAKRYVFMPNYANHPDNVTKTGARSFNAATDFVKKMQEQFLSLNFDKEIVTEDQYNTMIGMAAALQANTSARDLLRDGEAEVSLVWDDPDTGLRCKCRVDWMTEKAGVFVDLKTTADASDFERSILKYGYHRQTAFYQRGLLLAAGIEAVPWVIAAETKAPFGCRSAPMDTEALRLGMFEVDELLAKVVECQTSGEWPGYSNPSSWSVPEWYTRSQPLELIVDGETILV